MQDYSMVTVLDLANRLSVGTDYLHHMLRASHKCYSCYYLKKKSGKTRRIEAPNEQLKALQNRLRENLLDKIETHDSVFGKPGTSIIDALKHHVKQQMVLTMDIENFFPSIKSNMVFSRLCSLGFAKPTARAITRLITFRKHLPQGAPTSPVFARIYISPAAERISDLVKSLHNSNVSSIYVDDITISGNPGIVRAKSTVANILRSYGLSINSTKTRVMHSADDQISLNVKLNNRLEATATYLSDLSNLEDSLGKRHSIVLGKKAFVKYLRNSNYR